MPLIDALLMEFDREASTTRKLLERVPDGKLAWKPHEKSMTLGQLAWHVATIPGWIGSCVLTDGFDAATFVQVPPPDTAAGILEGFQKSCTAAKAAMVQLDDAKLMGTWTFSMREKQLMSMPRIALVRSILLNHSYHHRGQLSVFLRMLDVPIPPIYGPSADENPWA